MPRRNRDGGRGGKSGDGRPPPSREVTISKALSFVLRHGAQAEGIELDEGGWANVADLLLWRRLSSLHVTLPEIQSLVATNDKQRFTLIPNPDPAAPASPPTSPSHYLIRAAQGHSLPNISSSLLLTPILASSPDCPSHVVHGTYANAWQTILRDGMLRPMSRRHIHFARDIPPPLPPLDNAHQALSKERARTQGPGEEGEKVLSGMRQGATVLVWVDVRGSLEAGVKWWRSANGVVLTEGEEGKGGLGVGWVGWVERRGTGEVLWGSKGGRGSGLEMCPMHDERRGGGGADDGAIEEKMGGLDVAGDDAVDGVEMGRDKDDAGDTGTKRGHD